MEKYYNISDLVIAMDTFGRTEAQAERYRCLKPDIIDIRVVSRWDKWKNKYPALPKDLCEYLSTGVNFYKELLKFDGMMLHSSAVVVDGQAYLFTADPGTGKSTHTALWLNLFGDRAHILNDDKPALRLLDGQWYAYGTPWSGKNDISVNERVPLAGIAVLERGEKNEIERFWGSKAIEEVMKQSNRPRDMQCRIKLLKLLDDLLSNVPVWKLKCNMEPEAAIVSYEAMSGQKYEMEN